MEEQVVVIFAGTRGYLDKVAVADVSSFETRLLADIRANGKKILEKIRKNKALDTDLEKELSDYLEEFTADYAEFKSAA
jgi:F-type H+-transporting ATPase subunit alpha